MARSYYYNDQKLNQYIQPRIKKYYNYTHQKLVEEEQKIKDSIQKESEIIKKIEDNIKKGREIESKYSQHKYNLEDQIREEENREKSKIESKGEVVRPLEPNKDNIVNGRNIICLILAVFAAFFFGQDKADHIALSIIFVPAFFFVFKVIAYWILKQEDEMETQKYLNEMSEYRQSLDKNFKPSADYKEKKELLERTDNLLVRIKEQMNTDYKSIRASKFEIILLKKILFEFKRFKKRANERERTAKINAFESKTRSGAQNIKDKLLKAVRIKSKWLCPYCSKASDVNAAEADHIHPVNKGGLTTIQNMVLICKKCNSKKTNLMLRVFCKKQSFNYDEVCERLERLGKDV
jgi:hypothetical protein